MIDVDVKSPVHFVCSLEYLVSNMKTYLAVSCLLAFAASVSADPPAALPLLHVTHTVGSIPNPNYRFNYAVSDPSTGDHKAQWEARDGDVIRGAYSLVEPDGSVRQVEYTADSLTGFNAIVKRTGVKTHPLTLPATAAIAPVITKPVLAPIAPIAHGPHIAHVEHAPVIAPAPVVEEHAPVVEVQHAPVHHGVNVASLLHHHPLIDVAPLIAPIHAINLLPIHTSPWLHLHGSSLGSKSHIARRWAAGPISLHGKTLTIKTKH